MALDVYAAQVVGRLPSTSLKSNTLQVRDGQLVHDCHRLRDHLKTQQIESLSFSEDVGGGAYRQCCDDTGGNWQFMCGSRRWLKLGWSRFFDEQTEKSLKRCVRSSFRSCCR